MKKIIFVSLVIALFSTRVVKAQEYLVFERQKGINKKKIVHNLSLSQNEVELNSGDTILNIFNWYFTLKDNNELLNQVIVTATPLIRPNDQLNLKKISKGEYNSLNILNAKALLERSLTDLKKHLGTRTNLMPPLKTISLGLIIKDDSAYYMVQQKVLVSQFTVITAPWYFPNEFKNGVLNINTQTKTYQLSEIRQIETEMKQKKLSYNFLNKIYNKIYVSSVNNNFGINAPIYNFWEFPNDDVESSLLNLPQLHEFNLGLGSFDFLPNIGVINCSLDVYLKNTILFNQKPQFNITNINSISLKLFKEQYNNSLPIVKEKPIGDY